MASNGVNRDDDDVLIRFDVLWATLRQARRWILGATLGVTVLVAAVGLAYLVWLQPVRTTATLEFSPTFKSASDKDPTYPNGVPFSEADILGGLVLDKVHARNRLGDYCALEVFRSAFFVDRQSTEATFLASEYESRLAEPAMSPVERDRLEREYQAKRLALPLAFRLVFAEPPECAAMPTVLIRKALSDTLSVWADDSQKTRGVLSLPIAKFSPDVLDISATEATSRAARGDLIRTQLVRILTNAQDVARTPGAATVRLDTGDSISDVQAGLVDLIDTVEPLITAAGQTGGPEAVRWAQSRLASAEMALKGAQGEEDVYRRALADYSAQASVTDLTARSSAKGPSDAPQVIPQIDQSFIASIMTLAENNVKYRQELTNKMVLAGIQAGPYRPAVNFYQNVLDAITHGQRSALTASQIDAQLDAIVARGKSLAKRFNDLIDQISSVTLSVSAGLYKTDNPTAIRTERSFSRNSYLLLVAAAFFLTALLTVLWALVRSRLVAMEESAEV